MAPQTDAIVAWVLAQPGPVAVTHEAGRPAGREFQLEGATTSQRTPAAASTLASRAKAFRKAFYLLLGSHLRVPEGSTSRS